MENNKTNGQLRPFSIDAKTCTLKYNDQKSNHTIFGQNIKYIIPIYQRPYSWTSEQIEKFLSDIFLNYWGNNGYIIEEPMFIGTMQLAAKKVNYSNDFIYKQYIIDGQQRLTTFLILIKVLKLNYPNCKILNELNDNWLVTEVNNGSQQKDLDEVIALRNLNENIINSNNLNNYLLNVKNIKNYLNELIIQPSLESEIDKETEFDIDRFTKYLLSKVYFVVIETYASLSKTLQIFNSINTAGLDLNGGDIFKLRFYEYLRDIKQMKDSTDEPFKKISALYEKIESNNKLHGWVTDIDTILDIYKYVLVSKFDLNKVLYFYNADRFFEELFDALLINKYSENFKNIKYKKINLEISDLEKIIDSKYTLHSYFYIIELDENQNKVPKINYPTAEDGCVAHFIDWSRYSRYSILTNVFLYTYHNQLNYLEKLLVFRKQICKIFIIFSIRYQKLKNDIYYTFMYEILSALIHKPFNELMEIINNQIIQLEVHKHWYIEEILSTDINYNAKLKNIVCRLSAMLEEDYTSADNSICERLFYDDIDIEHIQSNEPIDDEDYIKVNNFGDSLLNSIGNLVILESNINRSIKNKKFSTTKKAEYLNSSHKIVRILGMNSDWDKDLCKKRKTLEIKKIQDYLFTIENFEIK